MGGPADPPEGTPEGAPQGGEDEYRSVVFDESFVRAARLQESSARERMADHAPAVRRRPALRRGLPLQALILVLLIAVAFGTAIYMGVRHPYQSSHPATNAPAETLRATVVPLSPLGRVPGADDPERLFAHSPAAQFRVGADGVTLPAVRRTTHFTESQVLAALTIAKDYVVHSALYPEVLTGGRTSPARSLLDADQLDQFDLSFRQPAADGRHMPTGWVVRFDPAGTELADSRIRVNGTLRVDETGPDTLEVVADHTLVYAVRPAGSKARTEASLFTVRRELHFRFDRDDLRLRQTRLVVSSTQAGPASCTEDAVSGLHPLFAGQTAKAGGPAGTDPYANADATALCGTLANAAQPKP